VTHMMYQNEMMKNESYSTVVYTWCLGLGTVHILDANTIA
jgi:hypothetical protein